MSEGKTVTEGVRDWLEQRGIPALDGWSGQARRRVTQPVCVVSVEEYTAASGGFEHYLGERFDEKTARWEELYGRRIELKLGLDLYAPKQGCQQELQQLLERIISALTLEAPQGLQVEKIICGNLRWEEQSRLLKRQMSAVCTAWLLAARSEGGEFLDFELRGGWKI